MINFYSHLKPLKIYGIKAYDKNTSRNEVIVDVDVMYVFKLIIYLTLVF